MARMLRFLNNLKPGQQAVIVIHLTTLEIHDAERHLLLAMQSECYQDEITALGSGENVHRGSNLKHLLPLLDKVSLLRVNAGIEYSYVSYDQIHSIIVRGSHPLAKRLIRAEHLRLLKCGPTQVLVSLSAKYHIVGGFKMVRSIT